MSALINRPPPDVVWRPLPGSQTLAVSSPCHHTLYEGTRGPGKTDCQLMVFRKHVGLGYGRHWRGVIFDREYKNLDDLISKSQRWFPEFRDGARFLSSKSDLKWVWPTGEELLFRQVKRMADYWNYHGQEFPFIGWNELCKYPTPELYDAMMSCNRSSYLHNPNSKDAPKKIPLMVFATTNPYGAGHNWVKSRFIDVAKPGEILRRTINVYNPRTRQRVDIVKTQVRIFGSYKENFYLSPEYIAELESIKEDNKRRAWLWGDWDIVAGGALDDLWGSHLVLPRFKLPETWRIDRSFDWGSTHPFSVGWWAETNGEEVELPDGRIFGPPKGSLIRIAEWYGCKELGTNVGLRMSAPKIAEGIKEREAKLLEQGWIPRRPAGGPADGQIYDVREKDVDSIASKMEDAGIYWNRANKQAGSRINGLQLIRDRLQASEEYTGPGLWFMDNCKAALATLPVLPRSTLNEDDVDTDAEDHIYDEVRYRVLAGSNRMATALDVKHPT